jgi:hypothetical protein
MSPTGWLGRIPLHERHLMAKHGIYRTSNKPQVWAGGNPENIPSTIAPPMKYRAPENTYTETRGAKLYKRGGTMATRVIKTTAPITIKIVNIAENTWREGL